MSETEKSDLTALTVHLLSAYVGNNAVPSGELAELIRTTRSALSEDAKPAEPPQPEHVAAVSARASLASRDHILSMIDGRPYKSLKRHLSTHGLTPVEYRARYNLPKDYPMVAPNYSAHRREVAKRLGLGRKTATVAANAPGGETAPASAPAPKRAPRAKAANSGAARAKRGPKASQAKKTQAPETAE